jgi:dihydrofolate reductase
MKVSLIVAMAQNGVIGRGGQLPWHLPSDLRRFKRLTMGHCLVMGRRTYESIGRPLPGRVSIVLTRDPSRIPQLDGVFAAGSLDAALSLVRTTEMSHDEAFVIGGATVYRLALARADRMYVTRVLADVEGDTLFPPVDWGGWRLAEEARHEAGKKDEFTYLVQVYERKSGD